MNKNSHGESSNSKLSKKTHPKDSFVTDDGQPKHRYMQQAKPGGPHQTLAELKRPLESA